MPLLNKTWQIFRKEKSIKPHPEQRSTTWGNSAVVNLIWIVRHMQVKIVFQMQIFCILSLSKSGPSFSKFFLFARALRRLWALKSQSCCYGIMDIVIWPLCVFSLSSIQIATVGMLRDFTHFCGNCSKVLFSKAFLPDWTDGWHILSLKFCSLCYKAYPWIDWKCFLKVELVINNYSIFIDFTILTLITYAFRHKQGLTRHLICQKTIFNNKL